MEESPTYGLFGESGYGLSAFNFICSSCIWAQSVKWGWEGLWGRREGKWEGGGIPCPAWMLSRVSPRHGCD